MRCNVITIFPDLISQYCDESILVRAQSNKLLDIHPVDLRDFTQDKHKTVDDTPYGGGAGMVMKPEPIYEALSSINALKEDCRLQIADCRINSEIKNPKSKIFKRTILMSPRGRQFDQRVAEQWSKLGELTIVCGRYEGIDQRVIDHMVDEEISIGPYVLAGGELGALVIIEAVARLIPGVLGNPESLLEETHGGFQISYLGFRNQSNAEQSAICNPQSAIEYSHYTKPADFMGWKVPEVLLSGNHEEIKKWREDQSTFYEQKT